MRYAKKKYQKGIAECVKNSPKSFWNHVKEETKSKISIGDLKDENGEIKTEDKDKAEILNNFFASVITVEGDSELPVFEQKVINDASVKAINIKPEGLKSVEKTWMCQNPVALMVVTFFFWENVPRRYMSR